MLYLVAQVCKYNTFTFVIYMKVIQIVWIIFLYLLSLQFTKALYCIQRDNSYNTIQPVHNTDLYLLGD